MIHPIRTLVIPLTLVAGLCTMVGCSPKATVAAHTAPLEVQVAAVEQKDVPIYQEWIGTLDGLVNADIKAEVSGYLIQQAYTEGTFVKKGQLLFKSIPGPSRRRWTRRRSAGAGRRAVGRRRARNCRRRKRRSRWRRPISGGRSSTSTATRRSRSSRPSRSRISTTPRKTTWLPRRSCRRPEPRWKPPRRRSRPPSAAVQSAKAAVETARINLGFTRLTSPIDGIPGIAQQQVGALVSPASGAITTVSTVDPIKVYFTASEQEYLDVHAPLPDRRKSAGRHASCELELILADGTIYPHKGKFYFADRQVDVRTGAIRLAGLFPNPGNSLRPGQYGRVRAAMSGSTGSSAGSATGGHRPAGHAPDRRGRWRQQGGDSAREARRNQSALSGSSSTASNPASAWSSKACRKSGRECRSIRSRSKRR